MMISILIIMRVVQMTLDEALVKTVDRAARRLGTTRSAFTRDALRLALARLEERELERRHRLGYQRAPAKKGEFDAWENEHAWGDE